MEPPQPPPPPPPPASPFDPTARPKTGGCPKPLIIGCVAVLLIGGLGLLGVFFYMAKNAGKVLQWSVTQMENGVMAQLPADVTQEERDRLRMAFANVTAGLRSGTITPDKFQPVQFKILEIVRKKDQVTREDILDLTRLLEETAAQGGGQGGGGQGAVPP